MAPIRGSLRITTHHHSNLGYNKAPKGLFPPATSSSPLLTNREPDICNLAALQQAYPPTDWTTFGPLYQFHSIPAFCSLLFLQTEKVNWENNILKRPMRKGSTWRGHLDSSRWWKVALVKSLRTKCCTILCTWFSKKHPLILFNS